MLLPSEKSSGGGGESEMVLFGTLTMTNGAAVEGYITNNSIDIQNYKYLMVGYTATNDQIWYYTPLYSISAINYAVKDNGWRFYLNGGGGKIQPDDRTLSHRIYMAFDANTGYRKANVFLVR